MTNLVDNGTCPVGANLGSTYTYSSSTFNAVSSMYPTCAAAEEHVLNEWSLVPKFIGKLVSEFIKGIDNIFSHLKNGILGASSDSPPQSNRLTHSRTHSLNTSTALVRYNAMMGHPHTPQDPLLNVNDFKKNMNGGKVKTFSNLGLNNIAPINDFNDSNVTHANELPPKTNNHEQGKKKVF